MARTLHAPAGAHPTHAYAKRDRVRVKPGVGGGVVPGDEGVVTSVGPAGTDRRVRVLIDGEVEPRGFDPGEIELVRAAA